jgi:hypothetical protein
VGFTVPQEQVLAEGEAVVDEWWVVAQRVEQDERLRTFASWLWGRRSGRWALVLQFAAGAQAVADTLVPGVGQEARLAFWPSAHPLRALVAERLGPPQLLGRSLPPGQTIDALLARQAEALAQQPFLERFPVCLGEVVPVLDATHRWLWVDASGAALPHRGPEAWVPLALSGGRPLQVVGEWSGRGFVPLLLQRADARLRWIGTEGSWR